MCNAGKVGICRQTDSAVTDNAQPVMDVVAGKSSILGSV